MKLSISNIAWGAENDDAMYDFLQRQGYCGLEIAPTRLFENPYDRLAEARKFASELKSRRGLLISSMQSIWRGVPESIFGSENDRKKLIDYTKKAIDFASAIQCENLVFGCPGNRIIPSPDFLPVAFDFFAQIGEYADRRGTILAIEPNPPYYNTNFINTTEEAFSFCRKLNSSGVKVNVDIGTCLNYDESVDFLNENITLVNHIHISEPLLAPIKKRRLHRELKKLHYERYFSIEMANAQNIELVKEIAIYVKEALNDY